MSGRAPGSVRRVLFICTGNYYRSRFAEELFNALASRVGLGWRADSRGLATEWGMGNLGPLAPQVVTGLANFGVRADIQRHPVQLREADLARADLVIALNEAEHRPLLQERFPGWDERVEYWDIADLG
jgi:protein-tyrosine phosphatase